MDQKNPYTPFAVSLEDPVSQELHLHEVAGSPKSLMFEVVVLKEGICAGISGTTSATISRNMMAQKPEKSRRILFSNRDCVLTSRANLSAALSLYSPRASVRCMPGNGSRKSTN